MMIDELGVSLTDQSHDQLRHRFNVASVGPFIMQKRRAYFPAITALESKRTATYSPYAYVGNECLAVFLNGRR